ncbi:uncharacterized protein [Clytia hemisphaerica]|uniref:Uncharacterized protein n=1 Tax=Clytia hemisphaerica TaxID=252671 RepID=A0A7M5XIF6_9CNID
MKILLFLVLSLLSIYTQVVLGGKTCQRLVSAAKVGGTFISRSETVTCQSSEVCCASGCCKPLNITWETWLGIGIGAFIIVCALVGYCYWKQKRKDKENPKANQWQTLKDEPQMFYHI